MRMELNTIYGQQSQLAEARDIKTVFRMMVSERETPGFQGCTVSGWSIIIVTYSKSIMQELTSVITHTNGCLKTKVWHYLMNFLERGRNRATQWQRRFM